MHMIFRYTQSSELQITTLMKYFLEHKLHSKKKTRHHESNYSIIYFPVQTIFLHLFSALSGLMDFQTGLPGTLTFLVISNEMPIEFNALQNILIIFRCAQNDGLH